MNRERELLKEIYKSNKCGDYFMGYTLLEKVEKLLAEPEPEPESSNKLTLEQQLIITGYTGILTCKDFNTFHKDVEERMGKPIYTHQFANIEFEKEIKELYKEDFLNLIG